MLNDPNAGTGPGQGTSPITPKDTGDDSNVLRNTTVVGWYVDSGNSYHGFVYRAGKFTTIDDPSAGTGSFQGTISYDMTSSGTFLGEYIDAAGVTHGFLDHSGHFTTVDNPGAGTASGQGTVLDGVNASGLFVGTYTDSADVTHGFTLKSGTYKVLNDPSAGSAAFQGTFTFEINRSGLIVGTYTDGANLNHGMTYKNGVFATLDDPSGTMGTTAQGVNDAGRIVGDYHDSTNTDHGYIYTPSPQGVLRAGSPKAATQTVLGGLVLADLVHLFLDPAVRVWVSGFAPLGQQPCWREDVVSGHAIVAIDRGDGLLGRGEGKPGAHDGSSHRLGLCGVHEAILGA